MTDKSCHSTHSKKDLCDIILIFNLPIQDFKQMVKKDLGHHILITLKSMDSIAPNFDYYEIKDIDELILHLTTKKCQGNISLKEREISISKSKSLIHFAKGCGGTFGNSDYTDKSQVISDAEYISKYADVPTCRMAIKLLNENNLLGYQIEGTISYKVKKQLEKKQKIKQGQQAQFSARAGHFVVVFD